MFHRPAHLGSAVKKFHLVLIWGNKKKLLCSEGRIPSHAHWHSALLNALHTQDDEVIHFTVLQVIFHLSSPTKVQRGVCLTFGIKKQYHKVPNQSKVLQLLQTNQNKPVCGPFPERAAWVGCCPGESQKAGPWWGRCGSSICPRTSNEDHNLYGCASATPSLLFRHPNSEQGNEAYMTTLYTSYHNFQFGTTAAND